MGHTLIAVVKEFIQSNTVDYGVIIPSAEPVPLNVRRRTGGRPNGSNSGHHEIVTPFQIWRRNQFNGKELSVSFANSCAGWPSLHQARAQHKKPKTNAETRIGLKFVKRRPGDSWTSRPGLKQAGPVRRRLSNSCSIFTPRRVPGATGGGFGPPVFKRPKHRAAG